MKRFLALTILAFSSFSAYAVPLPQSRPVQLAALAQSGDNFQYNPIIRAQAAPTPATTVVASGTPITVTAPPPGGLPDILAMIQAALSTIIAGLLAKIGFSKPATMTTAGTVAAPSTGIASVVTSLLHTKGSIQDPATLAAIDQAALSLLRSGIPGAAITAAGGLIPGAGPIVSMAEPELRAFVDSIVAQRLANNLKPAAVA
jgi:hypothetical protein